MVLNIIFSWKFLKTIKASISSKNNTLFSRLVGDQFKLDIMVPQIAKEVPKTPEGLPVSLPVAIPETQNNTEERGIMDSTV